MIVVPRSVNAAARGGRRTEGVGEAVILGHKKVCPSATTYRQTVLLLLACRCLIAVVAHSKKKLMKTKLSVQFVDCLNALSSVLRVPVRTKPKNKERLCEKEVLSGLSFPFLALVKCVSERFSKYFLKVPKRHFQT